MTKLRLNKKEEKKAHILAGDYPKSIRISHYEIEVPGVGRVRTGFMHADFHIVSQLKPEIIQPIETTATERKEIAYINQD